MQSNMTSPKRLGREGIQPGDVVWVINVGKVCVRNLWHTPAHTDTL